MKPKLDRILDVCSEDGDPEIMAELRDPSSEASRIAREIGGRSRGTIDWLKLRNLQREQQEREPTVE